jgi:hypothetical protein
VTFTLLLDVVLAAGIVYSVFVSHQYVVVVQLLIIIAITAAFASAVAGRIEGSVGTLTQDEVIVERGKAILGSYFPGPEGRYPIRDFVAVRLVQSSGPVDASVNGSPHARIYLIGKEPTPDILIARVPGVGIHTAQEFAEALGLRLEDTRAPY